MAKVTVNGQLSTAISPHQTKNTVTINEDYGEIEGMTREELLQLIDKAASEGSKVLDLSGLGLEELPPEIGKCTQLQRLILGKWIDEYEGLGNKLTALPPEIGKLTNLKILQLGFNALSSLPDEMSQLVNLKALHLPKNRFTQLPDCIFQLHQLVYLDCRENGIAIVPPQIKNLKLLETLKIGGNKLNFLPDEIEILQHLKGFYLWANPIESLPESLGKLENIRTFSLSETALPEIPELIGKFSKLRCLQIWDSQIAKIPEVLGQLSNLTQLDLRFNDIAEIPEILGKMSNLTRLSLSGNEIAEIPDVLGQLSNLTELDLNGNQIEEIPEILGKMSNLTHLDLSENQIEEIPEFFGKLSNLTQLYLSGNWIEEIPEFFGEMSHLTQLDLNSNQIAEIPAVLGQLSNLTQLSLGENRIAEIPEALGQLSNLTQLYLSNNRIAEIPEALGQLSNLTQLYLWSNRIAEIPEALGQLSNLTQLYLWENQIAEIPDVLEKMSHLTELYLSSNQIAEIPEALGQLSNLTHLYLSNNRIVKIPEALGQLSNLTELDLTNNQIAEIPESLRKMDKLQKLDLRGNPIPIPPEILGKNKLSGNPRDVRNILDFYFQTRDPNATEELNEAKLLIVGEGEAGKTTLANKLLNPNYELKEREPSTEGIDVMRWEFPQPNGKPFRVHLWDFGGQEIYHATHQFFLTERSLYVLLVDNRRQNPNLCYWLSIIELLSKGSPVFLVQNEKQDIRCEISLSQQRRDFRNLEKDFPTNLATNRGLADLQRALQNRIATLEHISTPIPKRWANVRYVLENYSQRQTHIEVGEFFNICVSQGFKKSDKTAMLSLSKYLHDLGIILHFQKDPILKNIVILRPELATNAVYKLIGNKKVTDNGEVTDNAEIIANCGYFTRENLKQIWGDTQYRDLHDELLHLMKHFKLCYEIPSKPRQYIAPQLLPLETPDYEWDDSDNLILRYEYDFMPKGIITRFIVEMHLLIYRPQSDLPKGRGDIVWRDGVILADNYAKAEVIENYHQREIRIRVSGNHKKSLLDRIRHELWKIHATYDDRLKYQEFIPCNCSECKGSQDPHLYDFEKLRRRLANHRYEVECEKSYQMVQVRRLMEDFPDNLQQWEEKERISGINQLDSGDTSSIQLNINIDNKKMTQNYPQNNNFPGAQIGSVAIANEVKDSAQQTASGGIHIDNANTVELLKLISSMRETAMQFPEDIREDIIIDIQDVETEINKPKDQWDRPRLKKCLKGIVAGAAAIGVGISGAVDLANSTIDLGEKVGIEIQVPWAR
ncbi:MAG: leucine-rich repeat domain-containing protein [Microcoleus sp. PH2017_01_SCD_O_A]|uniref:leucine-rich repeat domain-containing protein n=2 Tax=unclassified Microcoleus TaxID=2642155 RepID=UPI001D40978E|nr:MULTISPECIES: leucine-rich repeat domain-containing protein [unclassified Microcoleus]MCC3569345.1 leucine-rich repeat domain-containing protein [Microcoleus sp. PH2017_31_RDM_U_A]MCC3641929.1 leucine-rich repeat domain-containing protein [Microcoleus sp. PH2017_33_LGB_O_A]TAF89999.1 MAG: GTPase [Oscillatoriales cyanobacterium]MCC3427757.1 leucine-rich repeat domain-containing protein [Microcoleus sp. PH2017_01_SCD_O_A]MCC3448932.1 leucine-rich repeat domain-containing protein [Microcoleus 